MISVLPRFKHAFRLFNDVDANVYDLLSRANCSAILNC